MTSDKQVPAVDGVKTGRQADAVRTGDSPKRQGDKLASAGAAAAEAVPSTPGTGDSPKLHGDELQHAVDKAASR